MQTSMIIESMPNIYRKVVKMWFNRWYRLKPPPMVNYWLRKEAALAKITFGPDGTRQMYIEGEDQPHQGFPRSHVLFSSIGRLKHVYKTKFFNPVAERLRTRTRPSLDEVKTMLEPAQKDFQAAAANTTVDQTATHRMAPAVRELWRAFEELENAEVVEDMKLRVRMFKEVLCFFLQEDDAYRYRWQWLMERLDMKKVRLSKEDKYFFRGKYFKVDHDKFDY